MQQRERLYPDGTDIQQDEKARKWTRRYREQHRKSGNGSLYSWNVKPCLEEIKGR